MHIKAQEVATQCNITTGRSTQKYQIDKAENPRNWLHPADIVNVNVNDTKDEGEEHWWNIFTHGSRSEQGVGSGVAVFTGKVLEEQLKFKLDDRCSNNQAKQLAIVKALEVIEMQEVKNNEPGRAVIYTDSKITLDSIIYAKNHEHLVEEIWKRTLKKKKKELENKT
jgi:ribonuclease HI